MIFFFLALGMSYRHPKVKGFKDEPKKWATWGPEEHPRNSALYELNVKILFGRPKVAPYARWSRRSFHYLASSFSSVLITRNLFILAKLWLTFLSSVNRFDVWSIVTSYSVYSTLPFNTRHNAVWYIIIYHVWLHNISLKSTAEAELISRQPGSADLSKPCSSMSTVLSTSRKPLDNV